MVKINIKKIEMIYMFFISIEKLFIVILHFISHTKENHLNN